MRGLLLVAVTILLSGCSDLPEMGGKDGDQGPVNYSAIGLSIVDVDLETTVVELPEGAVPSTEDGSAPEGYTVKGNADSGKYHEPDGQWYDQTVAEFYFKTAEDAEAAGFERAGGGSAGEDDK